MSGCPHAEDGCMAFHDGQGRHIENPASVRDEDVCQDCDDFTCEVCDPLADRWERLHGRRRAERPATFPEDQAMFRKEVYQKWTESARARGDLGRHTCTNQWGERCYCETQEQFDQRTMNK